MQSGYEDTRLHTPCSSGQECSHVVQDIGTKDTGRMSGMPEGTAAPSFVPGKNADYLHPEYWDRRFEQV